MYRANVRLLDKPDTVVANILGNRMSVKAESAREVYYECYSVARVLSKITQETTYFRLYELIGDFVFHKYVSPRIFVHPQRISHYTLPDI